MQETYCSECAREKCKCDPSDDAHVCAISSSQNCNVLHDRVLIETVLGELAGSCCVVAINAAISLVGKLIDLVMNDELQKCSGHIGWEKSILPEMRY